MRVLVTGSSGFVGSHVAGALRDAGHETVGAARSVVHATDMSVDLGEPGAGAELVERVAPEAVVNLAAVADIAPCRDDPLLARRLNDGLAGELAGACAERAVRLVHVSTDQVFDGSRSGWREGDEPRPLHLYGETKWAGEGAVLAAYAGALVVRPGLVTGHAPEGRRSTTSALAGALHRAVEGGERPCMFTDEIRSPVAVTDLARVLVELLARPVAGLLHVGSALPLTRCELALLDARRLGFDPDLVDSGTRRAAGLEDSRPADLSLDSARLQAILGWLPRAIAD